MVNPAVLGVLNTWLTPIWVYGVGISFGLVVVVLLFALVRLLSRRWSFEIITALREGVLGYLTVFFLFVAIFTALITVKTPYQRILSSIARLPYVGETNLTVTVEPRTDNRAAPIKFRANELIAYRIESDQDVLVSNEALGTEATTDPIFVPAGEPVRWTKSKDLRDLSEFRTDTSELYITNEGDVPAQVSLMFETDVPAPQSRSILTAALSILAIYLVYYLIWFLLPKISVIAGTTSLQAISQAPFLVAMFVGILGLISNIFVPYYTFGEDVKMLKIMGLSFVMICSIFVALWTASVSLAEEVEGRTALTVLSKPIKRRDFVLGKFLGVVWPILFMFCILGFVFMVTVSYKVVFEATELSKDEPSWQDAFSQVHSVVPGMALAMMEAIVLAAISIAISTRLPRLPNLIICFSVYIMGHLVPLLIDSSAAKFSPVAFVGKFLATVLPVLSHFNMQPVFASDATIPLSYLGVAMLYTTLYCVIMMLLALALFEDRDLA